MAIDWNASVEPIVQRRILRTEQKARREAKFDLSIGTSISPKDADTNARLAPTNKPMDRVYWKEYGAELRRQRGRN
jgi:hypothetical protein